MGLEKCFDESDEVVQPAPSYKKWCGKYREFDHWDPDHSIADYAPSETPQKYDDLHYDQQKVISELLTATQNDLQQLDVLHTIVAEQQLLIGALKRSLNLTNRLNIYDPTYSQEINEMAYQWLNVYICRHFLNNNCKHSSKMCHRIHWLISPRVLMAQFDKISKTRNLRASTIINKLVQTTARESRETGGLVRSMLYELGSLMND